MWDLLTIKNGKQEENSELPIPDIYRHRCLKLQKTYRIE